MLRFFFCALILPVLAAGQGSVLEFGRSVPLENGKVEKIMANAAMAGNLVFDSIGAVVPMGNETILLRQCKTSLTYYVPKMKRQMTVAMYCQVMISSEQSGYAYKVQLTEYAIMTRRPYSTMQERMALPAKDPIADLESIANYFGKQEKKSAYPAIADALASWRNMIMEGIEKAMGSPTP